VPSPGTSTGNPTGVLCPNGREHRRNYHAVPMPLEGTHTDQSSDEGGRNGEKNPTGIEERTYACHCGHQTRHGEP